MSYIYSTWLRMPVLNTDHTQHFRKVHCNCLVFTLPWQVVTFEGESEKLHRVFLICLFQVWRNCCRLPLSTSRVPSYSADSKTHTHSTYIGQQHTQAYSPDGTVSTYRPITNCFITYLWRNASSGRMATTTNQKVMVAIDESEQSKKALECE